MIKVEQKITVYEKNGRDETPGETLEIGINSHWNRDSMIVISIGDDTYTVVADDLSAAIENAQNTNRH